MLHTWVSHRLYALSEKALRRNRHTPEMTLRLYINDVQINKNHFLLCKAIKPGESLEIFHVCTLPFSVPARAGLRQKQPTNSSWLQRRHLSNTRGVSCFWDRATLFLCSSLPDDEPLFISLSRFQQTFNVQSTSKSDKDVAFRHKISETGRQTTKRPRKFMSGVVYLTAAIRWSLNVHRRREQRGFKGCTSS